MPGSSQPARRGGPLALLKEALAGGERDFTTEPIGRAVALLAVPMVLEMLMESVFAVADMAYVSRLGVDAVATVGLTEAVITIVYAVAVGLSMAGTAMVARRIGEKDRDAAARAAVQAVGLGLVVSAAIAVPGAWFAPRLLELMGGSPALVAAGQGYTRWMLAGNATIMAIFMLNAVLRGAGDAALAMRVLWLANGLNIVLDPCLIFGLGPFPELGLTGAAVATTIGRAVGVGYQVLLLSRGAGTLRIGREHLRLDPPVMARLLRVSLGGIGQYLIATSSWVVLVRLVSTFGAAAVAGYTIAIRIILFVLMPSWGVANAAATLVGQNLGAGRPDRAAASVWRTGWYNAGILALVAVVFIGWPRLLVGLFTSEADVLALGAACLRVVAYGYGFYAFGMVMVQAFNGAGDTATPTVINAVCYWGFQLPLAWFVATRSGAGAPGVYATITAAEVLMAVVAILVFRRGRWARQVV
ncbi:MAG TPA: MATE family efflux transporter [Candidatus Krumholzibacteria bacterium]|nr:MATE family efflux transporter [Candidatus Krumholzibacteria bacterium]